MRRRAPLECVGDLDAPGRAHRREALSPRKEPMNRLKIVTTLIVSLGLALCAFGSLIWSCSGVDEASPSSEDNLSAVPTTHVAARFGSEVITIAELDELAAPQIFELRAMALRKLLVAQLIRREAKERNIDAMKLRDIEVEAKVPLPSEAEAQLALEEWMAEGRLHPEEAEQLTLAQMAKRIRAINLRKRQEEYYDELFRKNSVAIDFDALGKPELHIDPDGPSFGPESGVLTIVEFSDLTVRFTALWQPTLERLIETYGHRVRFLFKQKIDHFAPDTEGAQVAQAALCANEQGKYWPFRKLLFEPGTSVTVEAAMAVAAKVDLDLQTFEACVASGQMLDRVERDSQEAELNGLVGDPVIAVDGIRLSGAQPFDTVDRLLRIELGIL